MTGICKICCYVSLDRNENQCHVCKVRNVFEIKENSYKMLDIESVVSETEKKYIPVFPIVKKCGLISGFGCLDVHVKIWKVVHIMLSEYCITEK